MSGAEDLNADAGDRIATTEARQEGFYWVVLGQNPPEAVTVASERLVFKPRLVPVT